MLGNVSANLINILDFRTLVGGLVSCLLFVLSAEILERLLFSVMSF